MSGPPRKKLIEVALPLEAISAASRREKDKKTGTIRNVHKWFAPMPGPAVRALLFAALIDDPQDQEGRDRLLELVERLVPEDGGPPSDLALEQAHQLVSETFAGDIPAVLDPFCGGGSTLVEAQRLGVPAVGSDLNPVPVLITRVLTQLVPQVARAGPVAATGVVRRSGEQYDGFLADVRHYAERIRDSVVRDIGHLYPRDPAGGSIVAWLWARTYVCPNPACGASVPLVASFWLAKRRDANIWVEPFILDDRSGVGFKVVEHGVGAPRSGSVARTAATCLVCGSQTPLRMIREQGCAEGLGVQLMAVARDTREGRSYVEPSSVHVAAAALPRPEGIVDVPIPDGALGVRVTLYGMRSYSDIFTNRQLVMLAAFADAVARVPEWVQADGGDDDYARAIAAVLGLAVGKLAQSNSTQVRWNVRSTGSSKAEPAFGRHALPMVWDFAECNPFGGSVGDWLGQGSSIETAIRSLPRDAAPARVAQRDARAAADMMTDPGLILTDPPYFDQIGYADLSDYFYGWHRRALGGIYPDLYSTLAAPKTQELIEAPHRHGDDRQVARASFVDGFKETFAGLMNASRADLPLVLIYAHRQEENSDGAVASTGWDAMLTAMLESGISIVGTWPVHGTRAARQIEIGTNALASYVVLVCRSRMSDAPLTTRRDFVSALRAGLVQPIATLQRANIAAVDLAQAAIGPGIAVFSTYAKVVEADGSPMTVRTALGLINQVLDDVLASQEGDYDSHSRFAIDWFRQHGFDEGPYGEAEKLATAKGTAVSAVVRAEILVARAGKVRLLRREELSDDWDPATDRVLTVWETTQHLVSRLESGGEFAAAELVRRLGGYAEASRELAYWLYSISDRNNWAQEGLSYNALVASWPEIQRLAVGHPPPPPQETLGV